MQWGGRWEGESGWGTYVNPWLIHVIVWQKPLQYCKVISLQVMKINGKKKKEMHCFILPEWPLQNAKHRYVDTYILSYIWFMCIYIYAHIYYFVLYLYLKN